MKLSVWIIVAITALSWNTPLSKKSACITQNDSLNVFREIDKVKKLAAAWNNAINTNHPQKLKSIYADTVQFYVKKISPAECIASKERWLKVHPGYKQEMKHSIIYFQEDVEKILTVEFDKIYIDKSTQTVTALLDFKLVNKEWKLYRETDMPSEVSLVKKLKPVTLPKGSYPFYREYWMDTRDSELAHDMVPYKFSLELKVGEKISGTFSRYSGSLRSWMEYKIRSGSIQNGILEITISYQGSTPSKMHFKIIDPKHIVCIDKTEELYGKVMAVNI